MRLTDDQRLSNGRSLYITVIDNYIIIRLRELEGAHYNDNNNLLEASLVHFRHHLQQTAPQIYEHNIM